MKHRTYYSTEQVLRAEARKIERAITGRKLLILGYLETGNLRAAEETQQALAVLERDSARLTLLLMQQDDGSEGIY